MPFVVRDTVDPEDLVADWLATQLGPGNFVGTSAPPDPASTGGNIAILSTIGGGRVPNGRVSGHARWSLEVQSWAAGKRNSRMFARLIERTLIEGSLNEVRTSTGNFGNIQLDTGPLPDTSEDRPGEFFRYVTTYTVDTGPLV